MSKDWDLGRRLQEHVQENKWLKDLQAVVQKGRSSKWAKSPCWWFSADCQARFPHVSISMQDREMIQSEATVTTACFHGSIQARAH